MVAKGIVVTYPSNDFGHALNKHEFASKHLIKFTLLALCKVFNLNDIQGAKELLRKALQGNPNYLDAKMNLQILENAMFDPSHLKFTDKPLRNTLTHIENYC